MEILLIAEFVGSGYMEIHYKNKDIKIEIEIFKPDETIITIKEI